MPLRWIVAGAGALVVGVALYVLALRFVEVLEDAPAAAAVRWEWMPVVVALWAGALVAIWTLLGAGLPGTSRVDIAIVQLSANAVANAVPGGPAAGGAVMVRLLQRAGVDAGGAGAAIVATGMIAAITLAVLAPVAALSAAVTATLPEDLEVIAWVAAGVAVVLVLAGLVLLRVRAPMQLLVVAAGLADRLVLRRIGRPLELELDTVLAKRRELGEVLADRWRLAVGAAFAHWLLEFASLAAALAAAGATVSLTALILAYAAAIVLRALPITPGGLGLVEAGLAGTLVLAGVPAAQAVLGTLLYRLVAYWLALPVGLIGYLVLRRRHPTPRGRPARSEP